MGYIQSIHSQHNNLYLQNKQQFGSHKMGQEMLQHALV